MKNTYYWLSVLVALLFSINLNAAQVVVVNPSNNTTVNKNEISRIFLGKLKAFPGGGSVVPVNQKSGSAGKVEFDQKVVGKSASQIKAYWSKLMFSGKGKPPKELNNDNAIKSFIANEPNAIGYIDEANIDSSVKVILKL
ncbi:phosphate ABC transporter substrate-binding protein [Colwelliaceae bacterium MEBiC 14330]